jgi:hypothetical protein
VKRLFKDSKTKAKSLSICSLFLLLLGCGKPEHIEPLNFYGSANAFFLQQGNAFGGLSSIENSLVNVNGEIAALHDPFIDGSLYISILGRDGLGYSYPQRVLTNTRFTYVMKYNDKFYNFGLIGSNIYMWESTDLKYWVFANAGEPVLTASPDPESIFHKIWNVGVDVDDSGTWHMLAETSNAELTMDSTGLAYSTAMMVNGKINFDSNKSETHVIEKAGNPYLKHIEGKGMLALYGKGHSPIFELKQEWYVTASTFDGSTWIEHSDIFAIGTPGIPVCDPHATETASGETVLSVSFNQNRIYLVRSKENLESLYDSLIQHQASRQ